MITPLVNFMTTSTTIPTTSIEDPFANLPSLDDALNDNTAAKEEEQDAKAKAILEDTSKYDPYTVQELLAIYDGIIFDNTFNKKYSMRGMSFTLRTRGSATVIKVNQALDALKAQSINTYQTYNNYFMLAASLASYGSAEFQEGDLAGTHKYLLTLDTAIIYILLEKLNEFDKMVSLALLAGRENF